MNIDQITVTELGMIFFREVITDDYGNVAYHRYSLTPGCQLPDQTPEVIVTLAANTWTPAVIAAWEASLPKPEIPRSVSMRQARLQLLALGVLDTVNQAISGMSQAAQIEWEYATSVNRGNPLTEAMRVLLQWSETDLDVYFTAASAL